ncbi:M15 family metallopeptidase [Dactylosporangium sp. NPDC005555]|uniref:M15 family metallopeptidase n=1 Tax=Dactylosporangium sp. NPDC005555 TaxID=3154889 RepID=UPI0033A39B6D
MRVEGITGIATRMAEIRHQLAAFAGPPAAPASSASSAASFATALESAGSLQGRYENGRIPVTALAEVGSTGHRLAAPAATALTSLLKAAQRDGVTIGITDSYRGYDEQVDLARRKGLYSQGGLAAKPGTSDHGWGLAVDLDLDAKAQAWMRANGSRYGFTENTPREPWHWKFTA